MNFNSDLIFRDSIDERDFDLDSSLLIYDKNLLKLGLHSFIEKFRWHYGVEGGENLKQLSSLAQHLENILALPGLTLSRNNKILALGGGSVGDFVGFTASILKRGIPWEIIPTTWLSAIDSAHGGKTAINFLGYKNQLGTFYPPLKVYLQKNILLQQPQERAQEAMGEALKMAWIDGEVLFRSLEFDEEITSCEFLWSLLPALIQAKYKIVLLDPYEQTGLRKVLNLGHTLGHVIESLHCWPHGAAVMAGLQFAVEWSREKNILDLNSYHRWQRLSAKNNLHISPVPMKEEQVELAFAADKKILANKTIDFIFVKQIGEPLVQSVTQQELLAEARRQGWIH